MSLLPNPAKSTAPLLPPTAHLLVPLPPNYEGLVSARCTSFAWQQTSKRVHWWLIDPFLGSARNLTLPSSVARAAPACASWSPPVRWHAPLDSADIRLKGPSQRAYVQPWGDTPVDEFAKQMNLKTPSFFSASRVRATATEMLVDEESGAELVGAASSRSVRMTCHHISLLSV